MSIAPIVIERGDNQRPRIMKGVFQMRIKERPCVRCGESYAPSALGQKYCDKCRPQVYEEQRQARYERRQARIQAERTREREQRRIDYGE